MQNAGLRHTCMKSLKFNLMKTLLGITIAIALVALSAEATTYTGPGTSLGSSLNDGAGISSVVVNNTASTISFTINSSHAQASYIFYSIELQIVGQAGSGYMGFSNPFGPVVGISSGENAVLDTYGTGATPYVYTGGSWVGNPTVSYDSGGTGSTFCSMTVPLSSLGLALGQSFYFDVVSTYTSWSSGGPQAAYGALDSTGYPAEANGSYNPYSNNTYYDSATDANSTFNSGASLFSVQAVPEPTTWALMGFGLVGMMGRGFLRRAK
jgi:hypothetical protein